MSDQTRSDSMRIGEICNREVVVATENMSLKEAARLMRDKHVGSLVVIRDAAQGRMVVGMVTDRDITVMGVARDFDPQTLRVADIMSSDPVTANESELLNDVLALMRSRGVRRVPVTTDARTLVGIISLDDVLGIIAGQMRGFVEAIQTERMEEIRTRV